MIGSCQRGGGAFPFGAVGKCSTQFALDEKSTRHGDFSKLPGHFQGLFGIRNDGSCDVALGVDFRFEITVEKTASTRNTQRAAAGVATDEGVRSASALRNGGG